MGDNNTIQVNPDKLDLLIQKLESEQNRLESCSLNFNNKVGGGLSVDKITEIINEYTDLKNAILDLYEKTVLYMQGLSKTARETDSKLSDSMNLGG